MKQEFKTQNCLFGFVGIGPFSVLKMTKATASPFNVSDTVPSPLLSEAEVMSLFEEYRKEKDIELDMNIASYIYHHTNGHAGLVCFCGKQLDEFLLKGHSQISLHEWVEFSDTALMGNLNSDWASMSTLGKRIVEHPEACQLTAPSGSFLLWALRSRNTKHKSLQWISYLCCSTAFLASMVTLWLPLRIAFKQSMNAGIP